MNFNKQYFFIKNINRLLIKGYSFNDSLDMLENIFSKEIKMIKLRLDTGNSLSSVFKTLRFKKFVYEAILVGEKSNKVSEVLELVENQFSFNLKIKTLFIKFLLYPLILLSITLVCFELIRINLYPLINVLINNYGIQEKKILVFLTFNLIKIVGGVILVLIILLYVNKPLANIIPLIKKYRLLVVIKYLDVLLTCGNSLDEAIKTLKSSFNNKVFQINILENVLLNNNHQKDIFTPFNKNFYKFFKHGIINNDLANALKDYSYFHEKILFDQYTKITYCIQFSLFLI